MIREVALVSYLPPFMQEYNEPVAALEAENPEFTIIWTATDRVLKNRFIATADEYGISRFEGLLGIYPDTTDSLEVRRMRVRNRWFNHIPYTVRTLKDKITEIVGNDYDFEIEADFKTGYMLQLLIFTLNDSEKEELEYLLSVTVPANMVTNIVYESALEGNICCGGILIEADIITLMQK